LQLSSNLARDLVQRAPFFDTSDTVSAPDTSLDSSQFLTVASDGCVGHSQQDSQLCLGNQVTLDLQDQPLEHGAICIGHATKITSAWFVCDVQNCTRRPVST